MKKTIATLCLVGSTLALSACDTTGTGYVDTAPPYNRTAQYESEMPMAATPTAVVPAERVFQRAQTK
ncbi:MAG: hypothetical protein COA45_08470 [Zetaproteobacteria bacterium]|nr:MAG: hypothetical protein COA45_08470 [Zetaproteobacteria bacterium]